MERIEITILIRSLRRNEAHKESEYVSKIS